MLECSRLEKRGLTSRSPSHNDLPLLQRRALTQIRNNIRAIKEQVRNTLALPRLAINDRLQVQIRGVGDEFGGNETWPQGSVSVESFGKAPLWHTTS